jgi:hypothetical protein
MTGLQTGYRPGSMATVPSVSGLKDEHCFRWLYGLGYTVEHVLNAKICKGMQPQLPDLRGEATFCKRAKSPEKVLR